MIENRFKFIDSLVEKRYSNKKIIREVIKKYGLEAGRETRRYLDSIHYMQNFRTREKEAIKYTNDTFRILAGILAILISTAAIYLALNNNAIAQTVAGLIILNSIIGIVCGIIAFNHPVIAFWIIEIDILLGFFLFRSAVAGLLLVIPFILLIPYTSKRKQKRKLIEMNKDSNKV